MLPLIVSGPVIVAPQMRTTAAPFAASGPVILPPSTSSDPPGATVTGPVCVAAGADADRLACRHVSGPVRGPVRHGLRVGDRERAGDERLEACSPAALSVPAVHVIG